jgi:oligopeptide transport system substrate-binding protein
VLSVDRENIIENVTQGGQVPATGFVASGILDSTGADFAFGASELGAICNTLSKLYPDADLETYAGRCELAKKLYDEAVAEGKWNPDTTIVYNFNTSEAHKAIAEACGSDWETVLGLKITLENQEWATYTNGLGEHNFGVARLGWIADYNDPVNFLEIILTASGNNHPHLGKGDAGDPSMASIYGPNGNQPWTDYDALIRKIKTTADPEERADYMYEAEEWVKDTWVYLPLYYYTNPYLCKTTLVDYIYSPLGWVNFKFASLTE